jgi:pimeloyl-ACP methyl ester carboxylesterase
VKTRRNLGGLVLLGALALPLTSVAAAASPDAPVPAPPQEFAVGDPAFYDVPDPLPAGEHGDLVRWQVVESAFTLRYRIMYVSETIAGAPTLVTAIVDAPEDVAPFGGHRMLLYGHSATGFDDTCAPSTVVDEAATDRQLVDEFESMSSTGWVLVSTDYEGLGGPGLHPMLVGVSEGRSMLDAGRAARQLPTLYVGATTAVAGFEQGGHAALWAAEQAPQWTPELSIVATVVAAPASDVGSLAASAAAQPQQQALPLAIAAGLATTYPEALLALGQVLTSAGSAMLEQWNSLCFGAEVDIPGPYLSSDLATVEPFATLLGQNTAGTVATSAPLLILHGDGDERVPVVQSEALLARLCAAGQVVERRVVTGRNHASIFSELQGAGVDWLTGVAGGTVTPTTSCP